MDDDGKQGDAEENTAALMDVLCVKKGSQLQDIWMYVQSSWGKITNVCRQQLMACVTHWAHNQHILIDSSVYLKGATTKAVMELRFNLEGGVIHLSLADKGLTIMACRGRPSAKFERIREQEEALLVTENTRQLNELLRLSKGVTRAPMDNFWELKINIVTFMSLVCVLFGSKCVYYKSVHNVDATLELKEVMAQKSSFAVEHCGRIMWAILDNGRVHIDDVKMTLSFREPDKPVFPQLYCIDILRNVPYTIPIECANFPDKWKRRVRTAMDKQGGYNAVADQDSRGADTVPPRAQVKQLPPRGKILGQHRGMVAWGTMPVWPRHTNIKSPVTANEAV